MRVLIVMLTIIFAVVLIGVMLMNASENVTIRFWMDDPDYEFYDVPLGFVLLGAVFAGIIFTGIISVLEGMRVRLDNARLTRRLRRLQREVDAIRAPAPPPPGEEEDETDRPGAGGEAAPG